MFGVRGGERKKATGDLDVGLLRRIMIRLGELRETSTAWNPASEARLMDLVRDCGPTGPAVLGAPQESDESCGPTFRSAFPEVLKATTKLGTTESDDGVGARDGPVHPGAFETRADGHLAPGLHHSSGST